MNNIEFLKKKFSFQNLTIKKNDYLIKSGHICKRIYALEQGILKARYSTMSGDEFIKNFFVEGALICPSASYLHGKESNYDVVAIEDSSLLSFELSEVLKAIDIDHQVAVFIARLALNLAGAKEAREYDFLCKTATEKWNSFPGNLRSRVSQKDIAKYIGITEVALSRIKNRL